MRGYARWTDLNAVSSKSPAFLFDLVNVLFESFESIEHPHVQELILNCDDQLLHLQTAA